jgi:hypothetical protein
MMMHFDSKHHRVSSRLFALRMISFLSHLEPLGSPSTNSEQGSGETKQCGFRREIRRTDKRDFFGQLVSCLVWQHLMMFVIRFGGIVVAGD